MCIRDRVWELDELFHRRYVEAAAGPRLIALHDVVKPQAERYERLYVSLLHADLAVSATEHAAIARAIRSGDVDAAQAAVQRNWRNAADRLDVYKRQVGAWYDRRHPRSGHAPDVTSPKGMQHLLEACRRPMLLP